MDSLIPRTQEKLASLFTADTAFIATPGNRMDLAITLPRSEWLTGLLVPELQAIQLENFTGSYNSDADVLDLKIDMPYLSYDSMRLENLITKIKAERSVLNGDITIAHIQRDSLFVDGLEVNARTDAGALTTTLRVMPVDSSEQYRLGVVLRNVENIRTLHVEENLVLNGVKWAADSTNMLHFEEEGMRAENFILSSVGQSVELKTEPEALHILLNEFKLGTLTNLVSTMDSVPLATGVIDGDVAIPRSENGLLKADLSIDKLTALGTPIGTLNITAYQQNASTYNTAATLTNTANKLDAKATINTGETIGIRANADIDFGDIGFLKPFVSDFLYTLDGGIKGDVRYQHVGDRTQMEGALDFNNAVVGVIMTGATYALKNERLVLSSQNALLKDFTLRDSLGNAFELNGDIGLKEMTDPSLDLTVRTDKFQMINSTYDQNQLFYGDLFASTDITITGSAKNPLLKGKVGILPGTNFSVVLPGSKVELVQAEGIVVFTDHLNAYDTLAVNTDGLVLRDSLLANLPGVELDLRIVIENGSQFAVVLDPTTGDQAKVSGNGDLTFRYKPNGDMYLKGPFTIDEGGYTLEFYGLVKKRFDLVKGSSVRWNGDPLDAVMDIRATYMSESAPYALVASSSSGIADVERNRLQQPLPFEVVISVDGAINDPKIEFGIDLSRDLRNSYPKVSDKLEQLAQTGNTEERNRQVFGLLVLNSFIQDEASGGAPSSGIASSAARNSVNGLLTDQLNKLSGKYIKGVNIQLGVNTYDQTGENGSYQRTSVDYKVSKSILNDRLSFEVGGSVGVNETNSQVSNVSNTRAAQYAILYDLTKDGRFRIRGFHENAYDLYDGEITNSGVALMFTKEFEENERARMRERELKKQEP
ncbi:MAG: translocation/assembly module TamB domain-containing protein [Flavobacteriales bacterium]